jgi:hypothetical protein
MFEAASLLVLQGQRQAATHRVAVSSVAHVPSGYARSLRPCDARVSRPLTVAHSKGDCSV